MASFRRLWTRSDVLLADQPERPDLIAKQADILVMMGEHQRCNRPVPAGPADLPGLPGGDHQTGHQLPEMHAEQLAAQQFNSAVEINDKIVEAYTAWRPPRNWPADRTRR